MREASRVFQAQASPHQPRHGCDRTGVRRVMTIEHLEGLAQERRWVGGMQCFDCAICLSLIALHSRR